jgi:hypothetical protein
MKTSAQHSARKKPAAVSSVTPAQEPPLARFGALRPSRALLLPLAFTAALVLLMATSLVAGNARLFWSFAGAATALLVWTLLLLVRAGGHNRTLTIEVVLRKQHYVQAFAQGSIMLYWGWYWREVYRAAPLLVAQLLFAYAFDALLTWSRRDTYTFGFGPFPVVFSINLFLWFKPDWFYLQFLMVAVGFAAKELIRWTKDGRRTHIFNPSSFPLGLFSLVLVATGTTRLTWGPEIASTLFYPPHIYLFIFTVGLAGQYLFGVTTMTLSAAATMYAFGRLYFAATGVYFFLDDYIPIAVFLGMHLLFTDPSTSPRTELGRIAFGMLYAAGVLTLYWLLDAYGAPTFYDKLLAVPILNVTIQLLDRLARTKALARFDPAAIGRALAPRRRNLAYIGIWIVVFGAMSAARGVGDTVPGHWVPFWQQACRDRRHNACPTLALFEDQYCGAGSGWACNEAGILLGRANPALARQMFDRACATGFEAGCTNLAQPAGRGGALQRSNPQPADYRILLREGKGPLPALSPSELYDRACSQGWSAACGQARTDPLLQ